MMTDENKKSFQTEATRLADAARDRASDTLEEIKMASNQVVDKVRDLIEEGNVRRISLRKGERVLFEIPLTIGVGAGAAAIVFSPILAAVGAVAALVTDITVVVERDPDAVAKQAAHDAAEEAKQAAAATPVAPSAESDPAGSDAEKTVGRPSSETDSE